MSKPVPDDKTARKVRAEWETPEDVRGYYEALRDRLCQSGDGANPPQVIAVTSCYAGEGVSTVAANLALILADHGHGRVVLVDANLRRPSVHRIFGASLSPGLADVAREGKDLRTFVQRSRAQNLFLVCAGKAEHVHLPQMYNSAEFDKLLSALKRECSSVVFDIPPLSEAGSSARLAGMVDGVILVLEAERVRWEVAERAKQRLVEAGANVLGVILNKRRLPVPRWLYRTL